MQEPRNISSRRDCLRLLGRVFLLGAGAAGAAGLFRRGQVTLAGQTCVNQGICSTCGRHARCGLPAALSRRIEKRVKAGKVG
jgi:hypothetical protein